MIKRCTLKSLPGNLHVIQPLPVLVWSVNGVYVAVFVEANISASGETVEEAVDGLADIIASKFHLFTRNILGIYPRWQLDILQQYVVDCR